MRLSPPNPDPPAPPHVLAVGFIWPFELKFRAGQCVWCVRMFLFLFFFCQRAFGKKESCGYDARIHRSHLCLQVHDLLAHQRNGGAGLLPLHRLQLEGRGRHCFQVLPHPGWRGVGLSDALPCPLTRGLLLVLMGRGQIAKVCPRSKLCCILVMLVDLQYFTSHRLFKMEKSSLYMLNMDEVEAMLYTQFYYIVS